MELQRIEFVSSVDDCPDLSWLGQYASHPDEFHIDREARGDAGRNEFRYFNYSGCSDPEYLEQDYQRAEAYNRGCWHMLYLRCVADVLIDGVVQQITSGGLSGVESDSDDSYFDEIRQDELHQLRGILSHMGFPDEEIQSAIDEMPTSLADVR